MTDYIEEFVEQAKRPLVAFGISLIILTIGGYIFPNWWAYSITAIISYLIFDLIINAIIHGGSGIAQTMGGNLTDDKGHAYLFYIGGIVLATIVSSLYSEIILNALYSLIGQYTAFGGSLIVSVFVYIDFELRFYKRE